MLFSYTMNINHKQEKKYIFMYLYIYLSIQKELQFRVNIKNEDRGTVASYLIKHQAMKMYAGVRFT